MGNLLTFVHVGSAVAVVMSISLILKSGKIADFEMVSRALERVSDSLIDGIGLLALGRGIATSMIALMAMTVGKWALGMTRKHRWTAHWMRYE